MKSRVKIKVIKKDEIKPVEKPETTETISEEENASRLASTVSDWVNEFHDRRREETRAAIEQFGS